MKIITIIAIWGEHYSPEEASLYATMKEAKAHLEIEANDVSYSILDAERYKRRAKVRRFTVDERAWQRFQEIKYLHGNQITTFQTHIHTLGVPQ